MSWLQRQPKLVVRFREGERDALAGVYWAYVKKVADLITFGFTTRSTPPARVEGLQEAQAQRDALQEVFVRAFARPARLAYDGLRPYGPYLLQIGRNLRIDQLRRIPSLSAV